MNWKTSYDIHFFVHKNQWCWGMFRCLSDCWEDALTVLIGWSPTMAEQIPTRVEIGLKKRVVPTTNQIGQSPNYTSTTTIMLLWMNDTLKNAWTLLEGDVDKPENSNSTYTLKTRITLSSLKHLMRPFEVGRPFEGRRNRPKRMCSRPRVLNTSSRPRTRP